MRYRKFEKPIKVKFWDYLRSNWSDGIGYGDEIVSAKSMKTFSIKEIYDNAPRRIEEPVALYKSPEDDKKCEIILIQLE